MRESQFQSSLRLKLTKAGALVFNVHGHAMQAPGWPDLQVYSPMWTGHLELKVGRGSLSIHQKRVIEALRRRLSPAFVLREDGTLLDHTGKKDGVIDLRGDGRSILEELQVYSDLAGMLTSSNLRRIGKPYVEAKSFVRPCDPPNSTTN